MIVYLTQIAGKCALVVKASDAERDAIFGGHKRHVLGHLLTHIERLHLIAITRYIKLSKMQNLNIFLINEILYSNL